MPSSKDNPVSEPAHCPVRTTLALIGGKHKAFIPVSYTPLTLPTIA